MLANYLKIALRSLLRNPTYSFINIVGLSAGIAVSLIIFLYVVHEYSFDKFHRHSDQIWKAMASTKYGEQMVLMPVSGGTGPFLKANHKEVKNYVRLEENGRAIFQSDNSHVNHEKEFAFTDTSFFSIFDFSLSAGNYHALERPGTVVITPAIAKKYFGTPDCLGKILTYNGAFPLEVVGILNEIPSNSSLQFNILASFSTLGTIPSEKDHYNEGSPGTGNYTTYILLDDDTVIPALAASIARSSKSGNEQKFQFMPFRLLHQSSTYLFLFLVVAIIILVLALINYMSLATATATMRSKEVGVRKVIGAGRTSVALQFYFESALTTAIAFVFAIVWLKLLLPVYLNALQLSLDATFMTSPQFLGLGALLLVICVVLAGSYPSIVLSNFKPADTLKGRHGARKGSTVRKIFTVFQFTTSVALIMITLAIQHQLTFMRNKKIGLNRDQVMVIPVGSKNHAALTGLKNGIRDLSGVKQVAAASISLYTRGYNASFMKTPLTHEDIFMGTLSVDQNFMSTLGIEWVDKPDTLTKKGFVVNEAALDKLKIRKSDIGINLSTDEKNFYPLTGIVRNFTFGYIYGKVDGLLFTITSDTSTLITREGATLYVKIDPKVNIRDNVAAIATLFRKTHADQPFEYYFLDDAFQKLFQSEDRLARIFNAFTGTAIVLACLGLFGLITFAAISRTKEIGIRKVLGADPAGIFLLLSKDFLLLIVTGTAIAIPIATSYIQKWLTHFPDRTEIPWWFGAAAAGIALALALVTISAQVARAALSNPVDALRNE